jgi:hypothetical protein
VEFFVIVLLCIYSHTAYNSGDPGEYLKGEREHFLLFGCLRGIFITEGTLQQQKFIWYVYSIKVTLFWVFKTYVHTCYAILMKFL